MSKSKTLLHVVMLDTHRTRMSIIHENEHIPYGRRLVTIELTEGQATKLLPREVGSDGENPVFEEIGQVWIENVEAPMPIDLDKLEREATDQVWRRGDAYPEEWPQWLRDADIEWCRVEISESGRVCWLSGEWYRGEWHGGTWHDGVWHDGYWRGGTWYGGEWIDGFWSAGHWHAGEWRNGEWRDGVWLGGIWHDGTWYGGRYGGVWHAGTWLAGKWHDGEAWRTDGPPKSGGEA